MSIRIATGDALTVLRQLPSESLNSCVTSPPYWLLRDYGVDGQIGLEPSPQEYIERLCQVFDEVRRVLRNDATCWVVIGDTYFGSNKGAGDSGPSKETFGFQRKPAEIGGQAKCLALIPSRFAIAMTDRGWILRNIILWHKPNVIPSSVQDRFTIDYEFVFFFVKERNYCFEPQFEKSLYPGGNRTDKRPGSKGELIKRTVNPTYFARNTVTGDFRNKRCVWTIPVARCPDAHFAVYPEKLIETPIKAGCPKGGTVVDPFCGTATTGIVCERLGRSFIGIELNPQYVEIAKRRIREARDKTRSCDQTASRNCTEVYRVQSGNLDLTVAGRTHQNAALQAIANATPGTFLGSAVCVADCAAQLWFATESLLQEIQTKV